MTTETRPIVHVRWMIRRDMPEVLAAEQEGFRPPLMALASEDVVYFLKQRSSIGFVAEVSDRVAGYVLMTLEKQRLSIARLAVREQYRGQGVGAALVAKVVSKLSKQGGVSKDRSLVVARVPESLTGAHLFFRSLGWRCSRVIKGGCLDNGEDEYEFRYPG